MAAVWLADDGCGSLVDEVACNDDDPPGIQSEIEFDAEAGTTYVIQIGAFGGGAGGQPRRRDRARARHRRPDLRRAQLPVGAAMDPVGPPPAGVSLTSRRMGRRTGDLRSHDAQFREGVSQHVRARGVLHVLAETATRPARRSRQAAMRRGLPVRSCSATLRNGEDRHAARTRRCRVAGGVEIAPPAALAASDCPKRPDSYSILWR